MVRLGPRMMIKARAPEGFGAEYASVLEGFGGICCSSVDITPVRETVVFGRKALN